MHAETLFFDWYEATLEAEANAVIAQLCETLDIGLLVSSKGMHGYDYCGRLGSSLDGERTCDVLWYADPAKASQTHVTSSGVNASVVAEAVRFHWPQHKVSRVDVSFDLVMPNAYERIAPHMLAVAREHGLKSAPCVEDKLDAEAGRSQYAGSPKSMRQVIGYEKGKQLRTAGVLEADPDWFRVELTTRPPSKHKARYAMLSPADIAAESPVMLDLCTTFGPSAGTRQPYSVGHTNSCVETIAAMVKQYGRAIRELVGVHCAGDPHHFGVTLATLASTGGGSEQLLALLKGGTN
jgi:hypothetical protein